MSADQPRDVLRRVRRAALRRDGAGMTDGQLLGSFVADRDEAAFEALLRRHGPMVLGVCRRVLRHDQDAEDAFQATFLVLARRAVSVGRRELLGNWLYGVAHRTALDARAAAARRRARERQVSPMPEPEVSNGADAGPDLRLLLDQELSRLPDKFRVPVVLCDLEGRTRRDVARQLGIPVGTLSGRLTTSHRMLARRLARRGLGLSGAALLAALSPSAASAGVPTPLLAATVAVATTHAAAGPASARAAALAEGVLKAMLVKKLKIVTAVLLAAGIALGAVLLAHPPIAAQPSVEAAQRKAGPAAAALTVGEPRVLNLTNRGRRVAWSPDGKTLAVATIVEKFFLVFKLSGRGSVIELWDVEKGRRKATLAESKLPGLAFQGVVFSADGKRIAATACEDIGRDVVKVWDAKTRELKRTLGPELQLVGVALSPDGKWVAASNPARKVVNLWSAATGKLERTFKTEGAQPWSVAFSAEGKFLAVGGQTGGAGEVSVWEVGAGKLKHTLETGKYVNAVAFSADGQLVAAATGGETVHVWDAEKGEEVAALKGSSGHRSVAFAPAGNIVAAGGSDGKVRLWDARAGELLATLRGHGAGVYSVAFSPDGKMLASTGQDQTVRLWPLSRRPAGQP